MTGYNTREIIYHMNILERQHQRSDFFSSRMEVKAHSLRISILVSFCMHIMRVNMSVCPIYTSSTIFLPLCMILWDWILTSTKLLSQILEVAIPYKHVTRFIFIENSYIIWTKSKIFEFRSNLTYTSCWQLFP